MSSFFFFFFFFNDTATTEIYTLSLHDALPIFDQERRQQRNGSRELGDRARAPPTLVRRLHQAEDQQQHPRSEEHTSELQSRLHLVCRLLLEKKKKNIYHSQIEETHHYECTNIT